MVGSAVLKRELFRLNMSELSDCGCICNTTSIHYFSITLFFIIICLQSPPHTSVPAARLLAMRLTDGKVTAKAMEFKPLLKSLPAIVPPGTKVVVSNASVKTGVILLDDKSFQVSPLTKHYRSWWTIFPPCWTTLVDRGQLDLVDEQTGG